MATDAEADAECRLQEKQERQKEREEDRQRLELVREDIAKTAELIKAQFRAEVDDYNDRILDKLEKETNKLSESIRSLKQTSQQKIEAVDAVVECLNEKFVDVSDCMNENIVESNNCTDEKLAKLTENVNGKL
jgi:myosin heavy subunit